MNYKPLDFSLRGFRIADVAQFIADACDLARRHTPPGPGQSFIDQKRMNLEQVGANMDAALGIDRKSQITGTIKEIDSRRDRYFAGLRLCCKSFRAYPDPSVAAAATRLYDTMQKYGALVFLPYAAETAELRALGKEMTDDPALVAAVAKVPGIAYWLQELTRANDDFHRNYLQRVDDNASLPEEAAFALRKPAIDAWLELQTMINAFASADTSGSYSKLVQGMHELTGKYRDLRARREGNSAAPDGGQA